MAEPILNRHSEVAVARSLIMHVYPVSTGFWRRSVDHIRARGDQFTGKRVVAVAVDERTDPAEAVKEAFGDFDAEFLIVPNSPLQEVETLARSLEMVESHDPADLVFRCHAKGATHRAGSASHLWADAMFSVCLDFPGIVETVMQDSHVCGAFRSTMPIGGDLRMSPPAHFAGSMFWMRSAELFRRDWRSVQPVLWGAEAYPMQVFGVDESACLFFDNAQTGHLYDLEFWRQAIIPGFRCWLAALEKIGFTPAYDPPECDRLFSLAKSASQDARQRAPEPSDDQCIVPAQRSFWRRIRGRLLQPASLQPVGNCPKCQQ